MALTELIGRQLSYDHGAGRARARTFNVSTSASDMPAPLPGSPVFLGSDSGATGRVFLQGQIDETVFPGLYFYVNDYIGGIARA